MSERAASYYAMGVPFNSLAAGTTNGDVLTWNTIANTWQSHAPAPRIAYGGMGATVVNAIPRWGDIAGASILGSPLGISDAGELTQTTYGRFLYNNGVLHNLLLGNGTMASGTPTGTDNVAIGYQALAVVSSGIKNTAVGTSAGATVTTGSGNTILGAAANVGAATHTGCILLGPAASSTASYQLVINKYAGSGNNMFGTVALGMGGTAVVAAASVTANSLILLSTRIPGGIAQGAPYISAQTAGVGFTIQSTETNDGSTIGYLIIENVPEVAPP